MNDLFSSANLALVASAFLLGLVFNAAPGAVFAETVRHGLRGGFRPALQVQLGSLVGDALWAVLGLLGVGMLAQVESLRWPLGLAGVAYLLWLARDAWRAAGQEFSVAAAGTAAAPARGSAARAGMLISVTNPQNLAYWAAVGSALGAVGISQPGPQDYALFFGGFMLSSLLWCFVCAAAVAAVASRLGAGWARWTYRLCAVAFLLLALAALRDLLNQPVPGTATREHHAVAAGHP